MLKDIVRRGAKVGMDYNGILIVNDSGKCFTYASCLSLHDVVKSLISVHHKAPEHPTQHPIFKPAAAATAVDSLNGPKRFYIIRLFTNNAQLPPGGVLREQLLPDPFLQELSSVSAGLLPNCLGRQQRHCSWTGGSPFWHRRWWGKQR